MTSRGRVSHFCLKQKGELENGGLNVFKTDAVCLSGAVELFSLNNEVNVHSPMEMY